MKTPQASKMTIGIFLLTVFCLVCVTVQTGFAAAEATGTSWRPTYDAIMMCVNFLILAFIIVKLGKNPLKNFFSSQRESISEEIDRLTREKEETQAALLDVERLVTAGDEHIQAIKKRLAEEGETIKNKIIENARQQSEYMLAAARKNIDNQFLEARKAFRAELIELAINSASEKLAGKIGSKDHEKLVNQFLFDLAETRQ